MLKINRAIVTYSFQQIVETLRRKSRTSVHWSLTVEIWTLNDSAYLQQKVLQMKIIYRDTRPLCKWL